jgi:magnesium transporter
MNDSTLEVAAELATRSVPIASPATPLASVRRMLADRRYDTVAGVAVVEDDMLVGVARIEDVLAGAADASLDSVMDREPPVVSPGVDQEAAAWKAVRHNESSLAVVDADGRFVGLVPPNRLLTVLLSEHDEDISRLGGYLHSTEEARRATLEPVAKRFVHRLPWLLVGLAGALLSAVIVGRYEERILADVTLAAFLPGIVYLADAVGTQTEALVVRGLSVGVPIGPTMRREAITGVLVGIGLALAFLAVALTGWVEPAVATAVAISLLAACSVATVIAMGLPMVMDRMGADPAFGSGPLATVIQDVLSIVIYLGVATAILP